MTLRLVTPPAAEPVSLGEAKAHLRVDHVQDDLLIANLVTAAREAIEAETSRSLLTTAWEWRSAGWPADGAALVLPRAPLLAVSGVTYEAGGTATLDTGLYLVEAPSGPHAGCGGVVLAGGGKLSYSGPGAGGISSTGTQRTMEVQPTKLHQRTPIVLGSADEVKHVMAHFRTPADAQP